MRPHTLPPSEMKSLYGSMTRSAVSSFSYVTFAMASLQQYSRNQGAYRLKTKSRALTIEWQGKQVVVHGLAGGFAVLKLREPPAAGRSVFARILDHELNSILR